MDERELVQVLVRIVADRGIDIEQDDVVRRAMAIVVVRRRGLTGRDGWRKI